MEPGTGIVYLVGAGPGDPALMTRRSLELIAAADAILHDRLIPDGALAGARSDARLLYVGKQPGVHSMEQDEINALLVGLAQQGLSVVRLKGGDPFVFGRGGEEAEALAEAGVAYEVVPGISAGPAAAAYAGIPVTHRDRASAVALVTGHEDPEKEESAIDWPALAAFPGTLVMYMGVRRLDEIAARLIAEGRDGGEQAAVIERGTLPDQRVVTGALREIALRAAEAELRPPAVTVIGPVVELREELAWLERGPLGGVSVAVTRARAQASELAARLSALGARVIEAPAIRIVPRTGVEIEQAVRSVGDYDLVCVTSPNGADLLLDALERDDRDARDLAGVIVAAIGPGTARALGRRGVRADVVPERSIAEALVEALEDVAVEGRPVLVARASEARDVLPDALRERGADVDVVALYDTVAEELAPDQLAAVGEADYVTFTSSSTVRYFAEAAGEDALPLGARVVSIGPVTSEAVRSHGMEVHVEAERHDIDGLVEALLGDAAR